MKKRSIIFICLAVGLVLIYFIWPRMNKPFVRHFPTRTVLSDARPLVWLDDQYMLVGKDQKIIKFDTNSDEEVNVISKSYSPATSYECFSPEGGAFAIEGPSVMKQGKVKITSFAGMRYQWIQNWGQPRVLEHLEMVAPWWNSNPHDCTYVETPNRFTPQLLKSVDGFTEALHKDGKSIISIKYGNEQRFVKVSDSQSAIYNIDSSYDRTTGQYFWYIKTQNFNSKDHKWPLDGLWLTPQGEIIKKVAIPAGPWVKPFSFFYQLKYFSAGPSTYSYMRMYAASKVIYIHVWGEAVDGAVRGVYVLDDENGKWYQIISGEIDNGLQISPSGCRISFAKEDVVQIMDVCSK